MAPPFAVAELSLQGCEEGLSVRSLLEGGIEDEEIGSIAEPDGTSASGGVAVQEVGVALWSTLEIR